MDDRKVIELTTKTDINDNDLIIIEDQDGTKTAPVRGLRKLMNKNSIFETVEDMKSANLVEGQVCVTLGYYSINDGGAAKYIIEYDPGAVNDDALVHYLHTSDTLRAKMLINDYITPEQFGAHGDGISDDSDAINKCISSGYVIKFIGSRSYKISSPIELRSNLKLDFNNSTIIPFICNAFIKDRVDGEETLSSVEISNFKAEMSDGLACIKISHPSEMISVSNFKIVDNTREGIYVEEVHNLDIRNGQIINHSGTNEYGSGGISAGTPNYDGDMNIINISGVKFINQNPSITLNCIGSYNSVISKCVSINTLTNKPEFMMLLDSTSDDMSKGSASIDDIYCDGCSSVFTIRGKTGNVINLAKIHCKDCNNLIQDIGYGSIMNIIDGITMEGEDLDEKLPVFLRTNGTIYMNCILNINKNRHCIVDKNNWDSNYFSDVKNSIDPKINGPVVYELDTDSTSLILDTIENCFVDVRFNLSNFNISIGEITGGADGQRIYLISSTNNVILNKVNSMINISEDQIQLSEYSGIELMKTHYGWVQI